MEQYRQNRKVLYVDDESELLYAFRTLMRKVNVEVITVQDSSKIEQILAKYGPFSLVLSDQRMPNFDGVKVLEFAAKMNPDCIRVLITGYSDHKDTVRAINLGGISSYISKPWIDADVRMNVINWVNQYNLLKENNYLLSLLDEENKKLTELLDGTIAQTIRILGDISDNVAPQIADLSSRVKKLGIDFLKVVRELSAKEKWEISRSLDLFNLGFALLPASYQALLEKYGLNVIDDTEVAKSHQLFAAGLLKDIPRFEYVAEIIKFQAKNFDGSGEPINESVSGNDIPIGARLLRILIDLVLGGNENEYSKILAEMLNKQRIYDTALVQRLLEGESGKSIFGEIKIVGLNELYPGMVLLSKIKSKKGQLLLKNGLTLTETSLNILLQWHKKDPIQEPIKVRYNKTVKK